MIGPAGGGRASGVGRAVVARSGPIGAVTTGTGRPPDATRRGPSLGATSASANAVITPPGPSFCLTRGRPGPLLGPTTGSGLRVGPSTTPGGPGPGIDLDLTPFGAARPLGATGYTPLDRPPRRPRPQQHFLSSLCVHFSTGHGTNESRILPHGKCLSLYWQSDIPCRAAVLRCYAPLPRILNSPIFRYG